jgi:hypothetical protein
MNEFEQRKMAEDIREIKQAVLGDPDIGLNGLVGDMKEMKEFRSNLALKVAALSGFVAAGVVGGKALIAKLLGQ